MMNELDRGAEIFPKLLSRFFREGLFTCKVGDDWGWERLVLDGW